MTTRTLAVFVSCLSSSTSTFAFPLALPFIHEPKEAFCPKRCFWSKRTFPPSRTIRLARSAHASITNRCGGKQYCADKPHECCSSLHPNRTHLRIEIRRIEVNQVQFLPHHSGM